LKQEEHLVVEHRRNSYLFYGAFSGLQVAFGVAGDSTLTYDANEILNQKLAAPGSTPTSTLDNKAKAINGPGTSTAYYGRKKTRSRV
jgi:hypothetical protein